MDLFKLEMKSSITISAPKSRVWERFHAVEQWTDWCRGCLRSDVSEDFGWQVGDRVRLKLRMAGIGVPFNVELVEVDPETTVAWESTKLAITAVRTFTFVESADGTVVEDHKLFTSPAIPIWTFYPRPIIRRMTEAWLADLRRECELGVR